MAKKNRLPRFSISPGSQGCQEQQAAVRHMTSPLTLFLTLKVASDVPQDEPNAKRTRHFITPTVVDSLEIESFDHFDFDGILDDGDINIILFDLDKTIIRNENWIYHFDRKALGELIRIFFDSRRSNLRETEILEFALKKHLNFVGKVHVIHIDQSEAEINAFATTTDLGLVDFELTITPCLYTAVRTMKMMLLENNEPLMEELAALYKEFKQGAAGDN